MATTINSSVPGSKTAIESQLGAEKLTQEAKAESPAKADKSDKAGASAKAGEKDSLETAQKPLASGPAAVPAWLQASMADADGQISADVAQNFSEMAGQLAPPTGPVGKAFAADTTDASPLHAAPMPKALVDTPKLVDGQITKTPQLAGPLQLVHKLATTLFAKQEHAQATDALFGKFSPRAQALLTQASAHVAAALNADRVQRAWLKGEAPKLSDRGAALHKKLSLLMASAQTSAAAAVETGTSEVQLPSPALVNLEQAHQAIVQGVQAQSADGGGIPFLDENAFATGDVMALASVIMMQGCELQDNMLRDEMNEMQQANKEKAKLRDLQTSAKKNETLVKQQLQTEYSTLQSQGFVASTTTFDEYSKWRSIAFGGLNESYNDDGSSSFSFPDAEIGPTPTPEQIPDFIKKGTAVSVGSSASVTGSATSDDVKYGVSTTLMKRLNALWSASKIGGQFDDWLENTVGIVHAESVEDAVSNKDAINQFLTASAADPLTLLPPLPPPPAASDPLAKQYGTTDADAKIIETYWNTLTPEQQKTLAHPADPTDASVIMDKAGIAPGSTDNAAAHAALKTFLNTQTDGLKQLPTLDANLSYALSPLNMDAKDGSAKRELDAVRNSKNLGYTADENAIKDQLSAIFASLPEAERGPLKKDTGDFAAALFAKTMCEMHDGGNATAADKLYAAAKSKLLGDCVKTKDPQAATWMFLQLQEIQRDTSFLGQIGTDGFLRATAAGVTNWQRMRDSYFGRNGIVTNGSQQTADNPQSNGTDMNHLNRSIVAQALADNGMDDNKLVDALANGWTHDDSLGQMASVIGGVFNNATDWDPIKDTLKLPTFNQPLLDIIKKFPDKLAAAATQTVPVDLPGALTAAQTALKDSGDPTDATSTMGKFLAQHGIVSIDTALPDAASPIAAKVAPSWLPMDSANNQRGTIDSLGASIAAIDDRMQTLKDLGDVQQMRLQSMMDGRSKILETLSNMLKSDADLSKTLRDNLK